MYTSPFAAQDSAEFAITNWEEQITETDEFGEPITDYADEYQAPTASLWTACTGPDSLWNSKPLTEWEIYG
jgi:hypothetical protein